MIVFSAIGAALANATTEIDQLHDQRVLGVGSFVHQVTKKILPTERCQTIGYEEIAAAVCNYYGLELSEIIKLRTVKGSEPRKVLVYLTLKRCSHINGVELSERLGIKNQV